MIPRSKGKRPSRTVAKICTLNIRNPTVLLEELETVFHIDCLSIIFVYKPREYCFLAYRPLFYADEVNDCFL